MTTISDCSSFVPMKAAGGSYTASGQHSGFDFNGAALTGKRPLVRRPTVETSGSGKKRRVTVTNKTQPRNNLNQSNVRTEDAVYDKHLLANMGSQRLTSLAMRAGSRLGPLDRYGPFLKNLHQNGRITMSWNGTFKTENLDERHVSMQVFRHSLSDNEKNTENGKYPANSAFYPHILYPANSAVGNNTDYVPTEQNVPVTGSNVKNAFIQHTTGTVAFAPVNLPDLEDMSWNLNKLKLGRTSAVTGGLGLVLAQNVPSYEVNAHRRQSALRMNNYLAVSSAALQQDAASGSLTSNYLFNACIRYGTIEYEFMNKQDTGATVEVILYKVKKNQPLSSDAATFQTLSTLKQNTGTTEQAVYPLNLLVDNISKGYIDTVGQDYATENLQGRTPNYIDIYNNPNYPLLPNKLKKTVEGTLPFSEVMRNKFVMSAGSRRNLTLHLPGMLYNPASKPNIAVNTAAFQTTDQLASVSIPICDEDTYCVVLSCNGQKMTRFFDNQPKSAEPAGPSTSNTTFRINWWNSSDTGQQGSGIDELSDPNPAYWVPYMWYANYDSSDPLSYASNSTHTYNVTFIPTTGAVEVTTATVDVTFFDFPGQPGLIPDPTHSRYCTFDNFQLNGAQLAFNTQYFLQGLQSFVKQDWVSTDPTFLCSFTIRDFNTDVTPGTPAVPAVLPNEVPMGDNHGLSHIDYCATYTEHIGACVYKEKKERNLYDCGQPEAPDLVPGTTGSTTSSRMILPAVNVVRQAKRIGYDVDSSGATTNIHVQRATDDT